MYRLAKFGIVLTVAALACWTASVLAGPTVPYKDHAQGIGLVTGVIDPGPPPILAIAIGGSGEGTRLGRYDFVGSHTLNFQTMTVDDGTFVQTAADGSALSGTYSGTVKQTGPNTRVLDLTVEIVEGTGRLAGVTGVNQTEVIVTGPFTTPTGKMYFTFTWTSDGTWTLP
jgi:hypothetical protein